MALTKVEFRSRTKVGIRQNRLDQSKEGKILRCGFFLPRPETFRKLVKKSNNQSKTAILDIFVEDSITNKQTNKTNNIYFIICWKFFT